jgi:hypothetical protein
MPDQGAFSAGGSRREDEDLPRYRRAAASVTTPAVQDRRFRQSRAMSEALSRLPSVTVISPDTLLQQMERRPQ